MKLFRMQTLHSAENEHVALSKVSYSMPSKIIKQMTDDNAFSNLSRSLSPTTGAGNETSNSTGLTSLSPGN
jgi:hypothetical protein